MQPEPALSLVNNEVEMEMVPDKYKDVIYYEFAYDPVRLPLDQDPTQSLYDRKSLETVWETKRHAQNPLTKQWFNAKSAIPQTELRQEMEDYIKLQKLSGCRGAELEVIEEYTKILEEEEMKQFLYILNKSLPKKVTTQDECLTIWKKINLLRLYCQFDRKNIETFRSLHGFRYLNEFILQLTMLLRSTTVGKETKETAWDVCKEICKAIDVMGLRPEDIEDVEKKFKQTLLLGDYSKIIHHAYICNEGYAKIESLMLRMFCKIFLEMNAQSEQILKPKTYEIIVTHTGPSIASKAMSRTNADDISSENLNHGISILQRSWITTSFSHDPVLLQTLVNAIIICIAREINSSEVTTGLSEGQLLEAEIEARHNSEALEKGLSLVKDILMTEGPSAATIIAQGGLYMVKEIVYMFQHFTREGEEQRVDENNGPRFCAKKGCKIFECFLSRIAQLGLDISTAISNRVGGPLPETESLLKFVKSRSTV